MNGYKFFEDAGHGWLQVPKEELKQLGIADKITGFSYTDNRFAYLEEDQDASTYLDKKFSSIEEKRAFVQGCENVYHDNSPIRNYNNYGE